MSRPAALLLAAACLAALAAGCSRRPPGGGEPGPGEPFAAAFSARARGESGSLRFSGVLAAGPGGRLRVEIAGGGESFLLVSGADGVTAVLSTGDLHLREGPGSRLVGELIGIGITAPQIASVLMGNTGALPPQCRATTRRWRSAGGRAMVATRLKIRCRGHGLRIRLSHPVVLEPERASRAFAPLPAPPGHRRVDAPAMARALMGALRERAGGGGR